MSLSLELFSEVRTGFFRVLAGPTASIYVDALHSLEREASERHEGISREDAITIVTRVLTEHPDFLPETHDQSEDSDDLLHLPVREKARRLLDHLARPDVGWLIEDQLPNWSKVFRVEGHGVIMLDALRRMARPDAAVFTDKLQVVCSTLANERVFEEEPMAHLRTCMDLARQGLAELRGIEKSLKRFTERQGVASTLEEVYKVVFDQYGEQVARGCYAALIKAHLPARLDHARRRLDEILQNYGLLQQMQQQVIAAMGLDPSHAMASVRRDLDELMHMLDLVPALADTIDRRTAEFTRRSLSRSRYLQEVTGKRREQVKALFEWVNACHKGQRMASIDEPPNFPEFLVMDPRLIAGRESLYQPRALQVIEENTPVDEEPSAAQEQRLRSEMGHILRDALSASRANQFVQNLPGSKGSRIPSTEFSILSDSDLADVMAVLLHAESSEARYRVEVPEGAVWETFDHVLSFHLQRFDVIKR